LADDRKVCLYAALAADSALGTHLVADILGWHGRLIYCDLTEPERDRVLENLEKALFLNHNNLGVAQRVVGVVGELGPSPTVEGKLIDWLYRFAETPESQCVLTCQDIARLLHRTDTPTQTVRIVRLATDSTKDGYVRRYAVEALRGRSLADAGWLFLTLIQDTDANVRLWAASWYRSIEDAALRQAMFDILQADRCPWAHEDIARSLGGSRLADTGEELFRWFITLPPERNERVVAWVSRTLADLQYRPAIPELVRRLKGHARTRAGELLIISLGDLRATEALPDLIDSLEHEDVADPYWYARAFFQMLDGEGQTVIRNGLNRGGWAGYVCLLTLAMAAAQDAEECVFSFVLDAKKPRKRRFELLHAWAGALVRSANPDGIFPTATPEPAVSDSFRRVLYTILGQHGEASRLALILLISLEPDTNRLYQTIVREVPALDDPFEANEISVLDPHRLTQLGDLLRPWLNRQLASPTTATAVIQSCLAFATLVGDVGTWEAIQSNRKNVETATNPGFLSALEGRIRSEPPPRSFL
jgi:hypothetical protein